MSTTISYDRCFWVAISCACLVFGLLVVPCWDDGSYFYQFYNTIGLRNPFYNELFGQYFHFMKPVMLLYALLHAGSDSLNYRMLALVQSAEILLCLRLVYLCARRYASKEASLAGVCVFLYLLVAQEPLTPLRPETTVLLCCLANFWLCERFKETRSVAHLVGASAIAFLVAVPMHTCGAITCIYLLLFAVANRQQFSRKSWIAFGAFSCAFAAAGAAFLIYPGIASFAGSLALFSLDSERFNGLHGEYSRIMYFVNDRAYFSLLIFIASVVLVSLACAYKRISLHSLRQHINIILYLAAAFIGLGVLPSSTFYVYMVYYYLPLVLGFSVALDVIARRGGSLALLRCVLVLSGALALWCIHGRCKLILFATLYAGGFYLAAVFARRMPTARLTVLVVLPMLLYHAVVMVSTKIIFDRAEQKIRETRDVVLASSWFTPFGKNVFSVNVDWVDAKTQVIPGAGGTPMIELKSVAEEKAEQISDHVLVKLFGPAGTQHQKPAWTAPRPLGTTFYGLCNKSGNIHGSTLGSIPDFLERQNPPLRCTEVKQTPLSNEVLDTYCRAWIRGMTFVEYSCPPPRP